MSLRHFSTLLAVAAFATATAADAAVHRVFPGDNLQAAVTGASAGDTILVEPGVYTTPNTDFGLRITQDNLRLIGKVNKGQGDAGKVRLVHSGTQETGVYAAPAACGPSVPVGGCADELDGFYIRGFTVEEFPKNGIQTRFVKNFKIIRNESANNGRVNGNGIYPTISANGLVANNIAYGSKDTAMWVAASSNVRVIGNEMYDSVIGLEISVSNEVTVTHNDIHDNVIGIGMFHPNAAGNDPLPVMENWVIKHNNVYNNNLFPNPAPEDSFQAGLPPGVGILLLGVDDNVISKNSVEDNGFVGIGVLGWCTATEFGADPQRKCSVTAPDPSDDPAANNNLISKNELSNNGFFPVPPIPGLPPGDILYVHLADIVPPFAFFEQPGTGNCFEKNKPSTFTFFSSEGPPPTGVLPTDGC